VHTHPPGKRSVASDRRQYGRSEAEVDAAFAVARNQLGVPREQIDALLARIAQLVFGEVPDDARELDEPPGD
jgi:hypothetical protein